MGIQGLLPILKSIRESKHVREFARNRVGVDAYGWLHKGTYGCASQICQGVDTRLYVEYCMRRVRMLIHFGVTPVLVFDGAALPMKSGTHADRREKREDALGKAKKALAQGNKRAAVEFYQRACAVTPEMALKLIRECRKINVEYIVAPYEADAQLAWMVRSGFVDGVITEDSDLLVYGAEKVFYKMTTSGEGHMYEMKNLPSLDAVSMYNFTEEMFVYMCVCAGCDFFKGVYGLGVRKSHALVKRCRTMSRLINFIRMDRRFNVSKSFASDFARACLVFRHQTVYDINQSKTVPLRELDDVAKARLPQGILQEREDGTLDLSFLGEHRDSFIAKKIAEGLVHPTTLKEYVEPLDLIERPRRQTIRPTSFPEPPQRPTQTLNKSVQDIPGFQIQPANSGSATPLPRSANLRQRLTGRSRSFNPRRAAAHFQANNSSSTTLIPKFSAQRAIMWNDFHPNPNSEHCNFDEETEGQEVKSLRALAAIKSDDDGEPDPRQNRKRCLTPQVDSPTTKRAKPNPETSERGEAVKRAVARFAIDLDKKDKKFKFVPKVRPVSSEIPKEGYLEQQEDHHLQAPPSPDQDAYDLFARIDAELSRDGEDVGAPPVKETNRKPRNRAEPSIGKQVLLSRFFSNDNAPKSKEEAKVSSQRRTGILKNLSPTQRNTAIRDKLLPKSSKNGIGRTKDIERFKHGAAGKRVVAKKVHGIKRK